MSTRHDTSWTPFQPHPSLIEAGNHLATRLSDLFGGHVTAITHNASPLVTARIEEVQFTYKLAGSCLYVITSASQSFRIARLDPASRCRYGLAPGSARLHYLDASRQDVYYTLTRA